MLLLMLVLMAVHRPFIELSFFSFKPFMFGMVAFSGIVALRVLSNKYGRLRINASPLFFPVLVFFFFAIVPGFLAKDIDRHFILLAALAVAFAQHCLIYILVRFTSIKVTLTLICLAGGVLGLISIGAYVSELTGFIDGLGFIFRGNPNESEFSGAPRMMGLNNDPNFSSMNLSFYLLVSMVTMLWPRIDWKLRWLAIFCSTFTSIAIFATLSRGALLGIFCGLSLFFILDIRNNLGRAVRHGWRLVVPVCVFLFLFTLVIPNDSLNFALERIAGTSYAKEQEVGGRPALWAANVDLILDHPFIGVGLGNSMLYPEYFKYGFAIQYAHNTFLEVFTETGIFGFFSFLWIICVVLLLIWRARRHCSYPEEIALVTALLVTNVAMLVQMLLLSALYDPVVWGLWAVTAGVAMRLKLQAK